MNAVDMSHFIAAKSDQLNADDLMDNPTTITITKVTAQPDAKEQPVSIHYSGGEGRPFKPCKTMRRVLVGVWGKDASKYVGRSLTLYRDGSVQFGGLQVGGIRISHMSHINEPKTIALLVTRGRKAPYTVEPLKAAQQQTEPQRDAFGLEPVAEGPAKAKQTAEQWCDGYLSSIADCATIDDLMALQSKSANALAKLKTDKPELHERAVEAGVTKAAELQEGTYSE